MNPTMLISQPLVKLSPWPQAFQNTRKHIPTSLLKNGVIHISVMPHGSSDGVTHHKHKLYPHLLNCKPPIFHLPRIYNYKQGGIDHTRDEERLIIPSIKCLPQYENVIVKDYF